MGRRWWMAAMLLGCSAPNEAPPPAASAPVAPQGPISMGPPVPAVSLEALGAQGSAVVWARWGEREVVVIGDREQRAVRVVDAADLEPVANARVGGTPQQVLVAGGKVFAALRDENEVVALEPTLDGLRPAGRVATAAEPVALAAQPDQTVLVSTAWGRSLTAIDPEALTPRWTVPLPREPRAVAVSEDGTRAFVTHAVGSLVTEVVLGASPATRARDLAGVDVLSGFTAGPIETHCLPAPKGRSVIDFIEADQPRPFCRGVASALPVSTERSRHLGQAFALAVYGDEVFVPGVLVHPEPPARGGGSYGSGGGSQSFPAHEPTVAVVHQRDAVIRLRTDARTFSVSDRRRPTGTPPHADCLLPRAAAAHAPTGLLLVACEGSDQVIAHRADHAPLTTSTPARWRVPAGPVGVAAHPTRPEAVVWSQHAQRLARLDLTVSSDPPAGWPEATPVAGRALPRVPGAPALDEAARRGRRLFHRTGDRRLSADGRACASCHPDGREDGLTWSTPHGPRQTPMLAGRLDAATSPFGWEGASASVAEHLTLTFARLGGRGLDEADLADLVAYCEHMPAPRLPAREDAVVARGRALFHADETGCATCHAGGGGSDGLRHDVGGDVAVETPSLRFVGGTGPYFHDGRFATLEEMLASTKTTMGFRADLGEADRAALAAYLRTL